MLIAVSPYHLSTREPAAMASLLLGSRVVTLLPAPEGGDPGAASRVATRVRAYAALARSWAWARELFDAGVVALRHDGLSPMEDLHRVLERIHNDDRYAPLRVFMRQGPGGDEEGYLSAVATDILKAGPDPGLSVPLAAGLDRFASRVGALVARSEALSVAQNMEAGLGAVRAAFAVPVLVQADAGRLIHAREVLRGALDALRAALTDLTCADDGEVHDAAGGVAAAADAFAGAFEGLRGELLEDSSEDTVRAIESVAMIRIVSLPVDAVLRSGVAAMKAFGREARVPRGALARSGVRDETEGRCVLAMVVRVMGAKRG